MKYWHRQTWPRLRNRSHEVACHFCDTLHQVDLIEEGQQALCMTCHQALYRNRPQSLSRAVAFGITGSLFFIGMLFLPFITLKAQGNVSVTTAGETVLRLWENGGTIIAGAVFLFIILLPLIQLCCLLYLCIPLSFGKNFPGMVFTGRLFQAIKAWVMVEVFFLGTIVSLLKLVKVAEVTMGFGFWSMIGLMISLAAGVGGIDRMELWDRIEVANARKKEPVEGGLQC